jgi:hypothetical protein
MGNPELSAFASYLRANKLGSMNSDAKRYNCIFRQFADIFSASEPDNAALKIPTLAWFPGIQVVTARDNGDSDKGLFFSSKGGNNGESHNHNDVGNFLLYCDGIPVLVDAGVETYTKFTFSRERWKIWTMRSCYHNTPTINVADQPPGAEYRANDVSLTSALAGGSGETLASSCPPEGIKFSLDIAGAYPASAKIKTYRRDFVFVPGSHLELTDTYSFEECTSPLVLNLLCY